MVETEVVKKAWCGETESWAKALQTEVVFIVWLFYSRGIKLRKWESTWAGCQRTFKQKPVGRHAQDSKQFPFFLFFPIHVTQHHRQRSIRVSVNAPQCLANPQLPVHTFCTGHKIICVLLIDAPRSTMGLFLNRTQPEVWIKVQERM